MNKDELLKNIDKNFEELLNKVSKKDDEKILNGIEVLKERLKVLKERLKDE